MSLSPDALADLNAKMSTLNPQQREAVETLQGPVLVLAGAGSGKTTVLTLRIANLIAHGVSPYNIMATTFTNKAADEMRERLERLLRMRLSDMVVGTFHSICARYLREYAHLLGYTDNFMILDEDESREVIKSVLAELNISSSYTPSSVAHQVSRLKSYLPPSYEYSSFIHEVRRLYDEKLKRMDAMDFDDLLLNMLELLRRYEDVRNRLQHRFKYLHVDEFQDINAPQYEILKELRRDSKEIFVVGDDDQSIYGFRNAQVRFIRSFPSDFPGAKLIKLERNYRSTQQILDVANELIASSSGRYSKRLWTDRSGPKPRAFKAESDRQEARYVALKIEQLSNRYLWGEVAVLYRVNHLSRTIEEALISYGIPYRVYGGVSFYSRKEIKDILAYLRLAINPKDDVSFARVVNTPPRGIGRAVLGVISELAGEKEISLFEAATLQDEIATRLSRRNRAAVQGISEFVNTILTLASELEQRDMPELVKWLIQEIDYVDYLERRDDNSEERIENLYELINAMRDYQDRLEGEGISRREILKSFIQWASLVSSTDADPSTEDKVKLMTIHSAKGLEFPVVFVVGLEDDLLPHWRSTTSEELEEERRLLYVAVTRAKDLLFLSHSKRRYERGRQKEKKPSRFLREIRRELLEEDSLFSDISDALVRLRERGEIAERSDEHTGTLRRRTTTERQPSFKAQSLFTKKKRKVDVRPGKLVRHSKYGQGVVLAVSTGSAVVSFSGRIVKLSLTELT